MKFNKIKLKSPFFSEKHIYGSIKNFQNWKYSILNIANTIKDAIVNLNTTGLQFCFVYKNNKFFGTISDGDIRRGLLNGLQISDKCSSVMNKKPYFIEEKKLNNLEFINNLIQKFNTHAIQIINSKRKIIDIFINYKQTLKKKIDIDCELVVLSGGKETRLYPITKKIPKALIKINGSPILEQIILKAKNEGIKKCNLITNHFHKKIFNYFRNRKNLGVFLKEKIHQN